MQEQGRVREANLGFPLTGAGGEPVDLVRTFTSHGVASLPPMRLDEEERVLEATLPISVGLPRTVKVLGGEPGRGIVEVMGTPPDRDEATKILDGVRHILRLDEDLSSFYEMAAGDPELAWAASGAGRMIRSATVFEDVVKTICTTNCAWSATIRMVGALVEHLGEKAPCAPATGTGGRAFPTALAMTEAGEDFYRDIVRSGYRGSYLLRLSRSVAGGTLDLESLGTASDEELPDDEVATRLLALPGVGPYAAAHIMMMLGRYSRLILDSWTRPTYARISGEDATDAEISKRFSGYGRYAGLAFWLYITRGWVEDPARLQD